MGIPNGAEELNVEVDVLEQQSARPAYGNTPIFFTLAAVDHLDDKAVAPRYSKTVLNCKLRHEWVAALILHHAWREFACAATRLLIDDHVPHAP